MPLAVSVLLGRHVGVDESVSDTIDWYKEISMSRFDQAKMLLRVKKIQKELQKQIISVEKGDGAVRVEITGEQKIKKIHIDPEYVDLDDIGQLERWIEEAVKEAIQQSQKIAAEKMQPMMGALGDLGL